MAFLYDHYVYVVIFIYHYKHMYFLNPECIAKF